MDSHGGYDAPPLRSTLRRWVGAPMKDMSDDSVCEKSGNFLADVVVGPLENGDLPRT